MPLPPPPSALRLVVGLGNPGREYTGTRHNAGFAVLDRLAEQLSAPFRAEKVWQCELARAGDLLLAKPLTFMNLSGESVRALSSFFKLAPAELLVVSDEMALPVGRLRLRPGGSAGGHNGLRSIQEQLGTTEYPRLRVGVGEARPGEAVGHVLGRFAPAEQVEIAIGLGRAVDCLLWVRTRGLASAMNTFN